MPDLRRTRKNIKVALAVLLGVDVAAVLERWSVPPHHGANNSINCGSSCRPRLAMSSR